MLSKKYRLSSFDIEQIKKQSSRVHSPLFTILYTENDSNNSRFAFVVSSKVSKKAVVRNKIRRMLKSHVASNIDSFPNNDYVVIVKPKSNLDEKDAKTLLPLLQKCT